MINAQPTTESASSPQVAPASTNVTESTQVPSSADTSNHASFQPPITNSSLGAQFKRHWQLIVGSLVLLVLLVGAGVGYYLTQRPQDVRQRAYDPNGEWFIGGFPEQSQIDTYDKCVLYDNPCFGANGESPQGQDSFCFCEPEGGPPGSIGCYHAGGSATLGPIKSTRTGAGTLCPKPPTPTPSPSPIASNFTVTGECYQGEPDIVMSWTAATAGSYRLYLDDDPNNANDAPLWIKDLTDLSITTYRASQGFGKYINAATPVDYTQPLPIELGKTYFVGFVNTDGPQATVPFGSLTVTMPESCGEATPTPSPSPSVAPSPSPTPSVSPSPSPTPSPSPSSSPTIGCNDTCLQNADCSNSNHICYSGRCRLETNPEDTSCAVVPSPSPSASPVASTQPELPEKLPETGPKEWKDLITAGVGILLAGAALLLLL